MSAVRLAPLLGLLGALAGLHLGVPAAAADLDGAQIFGPPPSAFRIESIRTRFTHFEQKGRGFQSRATPQGGLIVDRGSEELLVEQPQVEVVARQGDRLTHRITIPVDIVTSASADAIDAVSSASLVNEAGAVNLLSSYRLDARSDLQVRAGVHVEENFRSWVLGFGGSRSFAEDNTVLSASVTEILDWFDKYSYRGEKEARVFRSTTSANLALTQLLSPTTVALLAYGLTYQSGELSNTWNTVPLTSYTRAQERLPRLRGRHALSGRLAQYLPWRGALRLGYRFYLDDWGLLAHTAEADLSQRVTRQLFLRLGYRLHQQSAPTFWTARGEPDAEFFTADSDLEAFMAHSVSARAEAQVPLPRRRQLGLELGYERYFRTNQLQVDIYTCSVALRL